jgi:hypothetical protein
MAKLSPEQQRIADRVEAVLTAVRPDGEYRYSKEESRAFVVACVLDLGMSIPPELDGVFLRFLAQIEVPEDASDEVVVEAIRSHFQENPLHPDLVQEMQQLGRDEMLKNRDDFSGDEASAERVSRLRAGGTSPERRAPKAATKTPVAPKVLKGLR